MKIKLMIKPVDIIIFLFAVGFTFLSIRAAYMKKPKTVSVLIQGQSSEWSFPLTAEETITVQGPIGNTIVKIHDNRAWVEESPCENQTCTAQGYISRNGQWAACLPNNVLMIIKGIDDDVDAVSW